MALGAFWAEELAVYDEPNLFFGRIPGALPAVTAVRPWIIAICFECGNSGRHFNGSSVLWREWMWEQHAGGARTLRTIGPLSVGSLGLDSLRDLLHDPNFLVRQAVELVDDVIELPVFPCSQS